MNSQKEKFLRIFGSIDFAKIRDHPNILIAANFWDKDRYNAASIFYRYMRAIDDLIDNHKAAKRVIEDEEKNEYKSHVNEWLKMPEVSSDGDPEKAELVRTIEKFRIPLWPFETFARSMIYDINNDGFPTLEAFLDYTEGASIAPASIFVHLTGLTLKNGSYEAPSFDVKKAGSTLCNL